MLEFVTDRTQSHVNLLKRLSKIPYSSMTTSQQAQWYDEAAKGAYNYADLNRVETAVAALSKALGLGLVTKTDWTKWDVPTVADMERYIGNVVAIRDACPWDLALPSIPATMNRLSYEGANNIEKLLQSVWAAHSIRTAVLGRGVLGEMVLGKEL